MYGHQTLVEVRGWSTRHWRSLWIQMETPVRAARTVLLHILKHSEQPHLTVSKLATRPSRHSPYELGNAVDCWERLWRSPHSKIQVGWRLSTKSAGRASREQPRYLRQKRNLTQVYLNDCYRHAQSQWAVVGLAGFGSFLGEPRDLEVPCVPSLSSSQILCRR